MKSISGKAFVRLLQQRGWILLRVRGSHHIFAREDGTGRLIVPIHGNDDLKLGMLKELMRDAGLTAADL